MSKPTITVDQMKDKFQALTGSLEQIQTTLQEKLTDGPAEAQAARLVAFALAKQAYSMLEDVGGSIQYLSKPEPTESTATTDLLAALVQVAEELMETMMDQFGVEKEAIPPFLYEANAIMISVIEDLVAKANEKLAEADALTQ